MKRFDRFGCLLALGVVVTLSGLFSVTLSSQSKGRDNPLPPLSWTCAHHPEVVDNKKGQCPICKLPLMPVRLDLVWTCPVHSEIATAQPGACKRCGRDLVRTIMALSWTCRVHPQIDLVDPGVCPRCSRTLVAKYSARPHGDHNPKHGGLFLMAPNNWHVEATHPAAGIFRLYVYDEYSKPFIPPTFSARLVLPTSRQKTVSVTSEVSQPYQRVRNRPYLEARVSKSPLPAAIVVKGRFLPGDPEYRFDFEFHEYSKEPAATRPTRATTSR